ncbi:glycoside hydrolase family 63 protein [Aaosphaeria arxii CBS 175.79]|uniref:Mannosyl-oligosaccharide glucosidase n=1 Tax=Aaosphaeria arxii CBS 175.79 TaxID=1450172 RepID=A0A6A5XRK7_9PLEO|nr:glycoside hydrolase family 63 protein [Aaosphaeria arxii CBS 175.79]KAF2015320.1 glycoside hydrolase family 63 protein [Aaosphaeria arxii CBS 175.79]
MARSVAYLTQFLGLLSLVSLASAQVAEIEKASNASLLWGPYRPNLYFGVRPRIPKSLMGGLLWTRVEDYQSVQNNFRHTCEQHELDGYGWDEYDVRTGGRQTIQDPVNRIDITTEFIKFPGGQHGGSWGVRIKGTPREDASPDLKTTVIWYNTLEGLGSLEVEGADEEEPGMEGDVVLKGHTPDLGDFEVKVTEGQGDHPRTGHPSYDEKPLDRTLVHTAQIPDEALWQVKPLLFAHMKGQIDQLVAKYPEDNPPPPVQVYTIQHLPGKGNIHLFQKAFEGAFEFDVLFSSGSAPAKITSEDLTTQIGSVTSGFSERFTSIFKPQAPFFKERYEEFSKSLFSNLIGGIGYFYGDSRVDRSYDPAYEENDEGFWEEAAEARSRNQAHFEGPSELYTSIPSRPFFPRGFLWDEGFHLLPVIDWDVDLTLDIIKSWFKLMDEDGWIGREQILGAEARSKVPQEFQVQYPHYANPPTLFMVITAFLDKLDAQGKAKDSSSQKVLAEKSYYMQLANREAALEYLRTLYPLLKRHYFWFRQTQAGDIKSYDREAFSTKEGYRWRGRTPEHILTSGLDDYPRPQPPHPGELHVDLISWVGMMTRQIKRIANYLGEEDDSAEFAKYEEAIIRNIDDLHWSDELKMYCDATIDDYEENKLVCHKGYISLFPFLTGLIDKDSKRLGAVLDLIADPEELWTDYGIRSLSKSDEFYHTAEDYWRGPIWMNMNYLAVSQLLNIAQQKGPQQAKAKKLYINLRKNLVKTVYESWKETGFAWEQYNPETGKGQRTQHFTGWTSLVVKIMSMPDLDDDRVKDEL